jgi:hypothetical protein
MWRGLPVYEDYILTQHYFSIRFHYSLLGYRSQQWIHLYSIFSGRYPGDESPAYEFTSSLFELQIANDHW